MNKTCLILSLVLLAACGAEQPSDEPDASEIRAQEAATPFKDSNRDYTAPADAPEEGASEAAASEPAAASEAAASAMQNTP